ncbi:YybH family protein [Williamwhitmania taraxaci]|uniref:DUF4440 domain-containing protein n=1 Tax=Williamwhitmania taraxaci TaxID=1640674 RepID=A0A1G6IKG4_9BACT|nr:DUF4440 domain-containing protein [Williamwhitmania taraxaci]SDC07007.1 hypothetical protein SAMN05216323_101636 [Williamwhitmania taraxaci]
MKQVILLSTAMLLLFGCTKSTFEADKLAIQQAMDNQEQCWSSGDIDGFMSGYWKSDSLRFMGKRGITKGWQTTLDNYKKSYPDKAAMGKLVFEVVSYEPLNPTQMFVTGKWTLLRERDTLGGYYSLIWRKIDGDWKVVFDHTS